MRRARGAPRGYAKSTHRALIKPLHDACYKLEKYIVLLSNTDAQTVEKLKDIRNEVLTNARLAADYGIHFPTSRVNETDFVVQVGRSFTCKFTGLSFGAQIRGLRFGAYRPTKIVLDDIEHSEEVFNEALRTKHENRYHEDIVKALHEGGNIEFIGTVLHRESLLKKLLQNPMYDGKLYKAVVNWAENQELWDKWKQILTDLENPNRLADSDEFFHKNQDAMMKGAEVLWPDRESYLALMKERIEIGHRSFMKEKQNEPLGSEDKVFNTFLWYREDHLGNERGVRIEHNNKFVPWSHLRAYGALDPATGQTKAKKGKLGDFSCLITGMWRPETKQLFVHEDWTKRAPPTTYIEEIFRHHDRYQYEKFGVETNLYRNLLLPNIMAERKRLEEKRKVSLRLPLYDIETVENKEKRIYTLEPKLTHGHILLNRNLSQEFKNQLDDYPHVDHDDCPDALEMLWGLVQNKYQMSAVGLSPMAR